MDKSVPTICAYCGELAKQWNEDHVISQTMWDEKKDVPAGCVKVPTCYKCNNWWSRSEGYFRTVVTLIAKDSGHPKIKEILGKGRVQNHLRGELRRTLLASLKFEPKFNQLGIYTGVGPSLKMDHDKWYAVVGKHVRGLYYSLKNQPLPKEYSVQVYLGDSFLRDPAALSIINQLPSQFSAFEEKQVYGKPTQLDDVFCCKHAPIADDPNCMTFFMAFYSVVPILAFIVPTTAEFYPDPSHPDRVAAFRQHEDQLANGIGN